MHNSSDNPLKAINDAYRSGYGQAKADMLAHVNAAIRSCNWALDDFPNHKKGMEPNEAEEIRKEIKIRILELQRLRAALTAIKPGF